VRNAAFSMATQLATASATAALTLFLVRALEPAGYGVFALSVSIGTLVLLPADFGISQSAARFIAERRTDPAATRTLFVEALKLKVLATGLVCVALFAAAGPIADAYQSPSLAWPLRGVAVAVFGQSLLMLFAATFAALGRVSVQLRVVASESLTEALASAALVLVGAGVAGAAFGRAIGYSFGALAGLALTLRTLGPRLDTSHSSERRELVRRIGAYAGALLIVDGAFTLFSQIDVLLIGAFLGTTAIGLFEAPSRFLTLLHYPGLAVATGFAPLLARTEDRAPDVAGFSRAVRFVLVFQGTLVAPTVLWASPIVDVVLGPGYEESAHVLAALAPYTYLSGLAPLVSVGVNYLGEARRRVPIAIGALAIDAALGVILIPRIGIVAGAIGTDVAYVLYVLAHLWICKRLVGLALRPIGLTFLRSTLGALAMALVLLAFGTSELSLLDWVAGGFAALAAYGAVLVGTGELTRRDATELRAMLSRRRTGSTSP